MLLKHLADAEQFLVCAWENLLESGNRIWRADTGHDILALRIHHELAPENIFTSRGVTSEGDAGAGSLAAIAKDHRLHVHRRTPFDRDVVLAAVNNRAIVHP